MRTNSIETLFTAAVLAQKNAYAARSEHKVGASVLSFDGRVFSGCNIESNVSGLGICAERCAINNAITEGKYKFEALMIYDDRSLIIPCGACLQYMNEFSVISGKDISIFTIDKNRKFKKYMLSKLLPKGFISKKTEKAEYYRNL